MKSVVCFIDGFNLYHAINNINGAAEKEVALSKNTISCINLLQTDQISYSNGRLKVSSLKKEVLNKILTSPQVLNDDKKKIRDLYEKSFNLNYLKWVDLVKLMDYFIDNKKQKIEAIYYFSAYAEWRNKQSVKKHKDYVSALVQNGVIPVMGRFKEKHRYCPKCKYVWKGHEEKETDVNIALHVAKLAFYKQYDEAFIVTQDSDIAPALKMVKQINPLIEIKVITPPNINTSRELARIANRTATINIEHIKNSLLPEKIINKKGEAIITRPSDYCPPKH